MSEFKQYEHSEQAIEWLKSKDQTRYELKEMRELNRATNGFRPSSINLVVAKSGFGKTNFLIDLACKQARNGLPTLFVSAEMTPDTIMPRFVSNLLGYNIERIIEQKNKYSTLPEDEKEYMEIKLASSIGNLPLKVIYENTIESIIEEVIKASQEGYVKHVFIDHFFELDTTMVDFGDKSTEKEKYIIEQLLITAKNYDICFIIATQFRKGNTYGSDFGDKMLDDIQGASQIRNKATNVLYLYETKRQNEENKKFQGFDVPNKITLETLKARHGITGAKIELNYLKQQFKFTEND
jgi:replicative DNA helicase